MGSPCDDETVLLGALALAIRKTLKQQGLQTDGLEAAGPPKKFNEKLERIQFNIRSAWTLFLTPRLPFSTFWFVTGITENW